jgi:DNA-binding MarR family transcriptional regulator
VLSEALGELLLLTTIMLASILASSNVVVSNNLTGRDVMDTPTAGNLLREVARLHAHSQREQVACCSGTTSTQCLILTEVGRNGPMTLADLGRRTSLDKGWLSRAVETLVQQGLLTKTLGEADRRTIRIALSPTGETRYEQLNETIDAHAQRVMARIPPAEREQVAHTLARLYQALQAEAAATAGISAGEEEQR